MKKLFTLFGVALVAASVFSADRWTNTVTIAAGSTNAVSTFDIYKGAGDLCPEIDSVLVTVASGNGTGTVSFATLDLGVETTSAPSGALVSGGSYRTNPFALVTSMYTYPTMLVTGTNNVAVGYTQTNYLAVAKPYLARQIRMRIAQGTETAIANDTVYKAVVITK
jgi:hypothetical protein